jgi:cyclomaltodextrinase / maltogenic alpha-amylase / neopullulanase
MRSCSGLGCLAAQPTTTCVIFQLIMDDFIFGTLATEALRLAHVHKLRDGVTHRSARAPRDPLPGQPVQLELTLGPTQAFDRAWVYWSTDGQDPEGAGGAARHGWATPMEPVGVEWEVLEWGYVRRFRATLPGQPAGTVVRYRLAAGALNGDEMFADQGTFYGFYVADDPLPEWARQAVVYEIFVDRFSPGNGKAWLKPENPAGFYGGTLRGVTEKMDYLTGLGVDVLWLTPIFRSPSHHGYDASDYFDIEPRLGTKQDLLSLLAEAHQRGLRVLLDLVPNHLSSMHATFQQALADPHSSYTGWFNFSHWPDAYETFFGVPELPQLNLRHPAARQHLLDAATYWLECGVDGFRLDYAIGPTPDFWADFRRATRLARPDCWTFGEVVEPSDSQLTFHGLLDGCLDFMLLEAIRQTFAFGRWDAARFISFLDRHEAFFPEDFSRPSFLDNHDMNRYLWVAQGDKRRLKIAALCQFTLAGPPVIYYGTEIGLSQRRDVRQGDLGLPEESRLPMPWGDEQEADLLAFYRDLIRLRRQEPPLQQSRRRNLSAGVDCLAYTRGEEGAEVLTVINLSNGRNTIEVDGVWKSVILATQAGCSLEAGPGKIRLNLPPLAGVVVK